MKVQEIIRQSRIDHNLTMKELAEKVGVTEATISRWESGEIKNMRRDSILKLAEVLGLRPSTIMGWDEDSEEEKLYQMQKLEQEFPEGVKYIRRANETLSPAAKKRMIAIIRTILEEEQDADID